MLEIEDIEGCFVIPSRSPRASEFIPLTSFDTRYLFIPYLQMVAFYPPPPHGRSQTQTQSLISHAKTCLSKLLVDFYPVAGRISARFDASGHRTWGIECNDKGVAWRVSQAKIDLSELDYSQPSSRLSALHNGNRSDQVIAGSLLLSIQVTIFQCGGIAVAWARNHALTDGSGHSHFLVSWSEICLQGKISLPPTIHLDFARQFPHLMPRPQIGGSMKIQNYAFADEFDNAKDMVSSRIFLFNEEYITTLKQLAGDDFSSFVVLSAHLWMIMTKARELPDSQKTTNSVAANCRKRLVPPLPDEYLGNAVLHAIAEATAGELRTGGLTYAATLLREAVQNLNNMEVIVKKLTDSDIAGNNLSKNCNMLCSSSPRLRYNDIDLGWGKPDAVRQVALEKHGLDGICLFNRSPRSSREIEVTICLPPNTLDKMASLLKTHE